MSKHSILGENKCADCKYVSAYKGEFEARWCFHPRFVIINRVDNRATSNRRCDTERYTGVLCGKQGLLFSPKRKSFLNWLKGVFS